MYHMSCFKTNIDVLRLCQKKKPFIFNSNPFPTIIPLCQFIFINDCMECKELIMRPVVKKFRKISPFFLVAMTIRKGTDKIVLSTKWL